MATNPLKWHAIKHSCEECECADFQWELIHYFRKLAYPPQVNHYKEGDFVMLHTFRELWKELEKRFDGEDKE